MGPRQGHARYTDARKEVVGGPQHDPQCDKRAHPKDRHHSLSLTTYTGGGAVLSPVQLSQDPAASRTTIRWTRS